MFRKKRESDTYSPKIPFRFLFSDLSRESMVLNFSVLPLMFLLWEYPDGILPFWKIIIGFFSSFLMLLSSAMIAKQKIGFKLAGFLAVSLSFVASGSLMIRDPFNFLFLSVILMGILFLILDYEITHYPKADTHEVRTRQRATGSIISALFCLMVHSLWGIHDSIYFQSIYFALVISVQLYIYLYLKTIRWKCCQGVDKLISIFFIFFSGIGIFYFHSMLVFLVLLILYLYFLIRKGQDSDSFASWYSIFFNNPARILIMTFFILSFIGTFLLRLPFSSVQGNITIVDAIFTSVSAVCVTGLTVLDTPRDFTIWGQIFILLLIQAGGLGIMGIATVSLHILGYRLSVKHEKMISSLSNLDRQNIFKSLYNIFKVTFFIELTGAFFLAILFLGEGDSLPSALWRGVFTSISAFCNAGFALQSDNLISYQNNPAILHSVSTLIIFGGLAPATTLSLGRLFRKESISASDKIIVTATLVLLLTGFILVLLFEWDHTLSGFNVWGKIHNAWFQSVTTRTAGFNSIDISQIANPTYMIMIVLMFIGGSPGGTAGGIKTITAAILLSSFWFKISNKDDVILYGARIRNTYIIKAVTIFLSGFIIWFVMSVMLLTTQSISGKEIIFEVTSAMGTVGLSMGATAKLDEMGKLIIIATMFIGRIGTLTLFMFLSDTPDTRKSRYPNAEIPFS